MSRKEDEQYKKWVEAATAKLEGAELEAFKLFAQTEYARDVFRGSLRTEDYYTKLNELSSREKELETWYEEESPKNEALIAERDALRAQIEELGTGGPPAASGT